MCFLLTLGFSAETWAQTRTYGGITFNESTDAPLKNAAGYYQITNIRQLAFVAWRVNNNATWAANNYILTADLDITGYEWTPIGNKYYTAGNANTKHGSFGTAINLGAGVFSGTFDGNGHTITGLTQTMGYTTSGLFGTARGEIKNLTLANVNVTGGNMSGALLGYSAYSASWTGGTTVTNCHVLSGSVSGKNEVGGLIGWSHGAVDECSNAASVTASAESVGGVVGGQDSNNMTYCTNYGSVVSTNTGYSLAGGIAGNFLGYKTPELLACVNYGSVTAAGMNTGGIVGEPNGQVLINSCMNYGDVSGATYVGGIAGTARNSRAAAGSNSTVSVCINYGNVSGTNYVSGIANSKGDGGGYEGIVTMNINVGKVTGTSNVGQISSTGLSLGSSVDNYYDYQKTYDCKGISLTADLTGKAEAKSTADTYKCQNTHANSDASKRLWRTLNGVAYPIPAMLYDGSDACAMLQMVAGACLYTGSNYSTEGDYDLQIDSEFRLPKKLSDDIANITWEASPAGIVTATEGTNDWVFTPSGTLGGEVTLTPSINGTPCPDAAVTLTVGDITNSRLVYSPTPVPDYVWTGNAIEPSVVAQIYFGYLSSKASNKAGSLLEASQYLEITYEDNVDPGVGTIIIKGVNGYCGEQKLNFNIVPIHQITAVSYANTQEAWTGSAIEADYDALTVTYDECVTNDDGSYKTTNTGKTVTGDALRALVESGQIILTYENNVDRGTATVTVSGDGTNFACKNDACKNFTFKIRMPLREMVLSEGYSAGNSVTRDHLAEIVSVYDFAGYGVNSIYYTLTYYDKNGTLIPTGSGSINQTYSPITIRATVNTRGVNNQYVEGSYVEAKYLIGVQPYLFITQGSTHARFVAMSPAERNEYVAGTATVYQGETVNATYSLTDIFSNTGTYTRQSKLWEDWYGAANPMPATITDVYFEDSFKDLAWPSGAYMFQGMTALKHLHGVANFNTSAMISMRHMFEGCTALEDADNDFASFTAPEVEDMEAMFKNCQKLTKVDFSKMGGTPKLTYWLNYMFQNCYALEEVDLSGMTTNKVDQMVGVFQCDDPKKSGDTYSGKSNLKKANLSSWTFNACTTMQDMFRGCWQMEEVDLSSAAAAPNLTSLLRIFYYCTKLKSVDLNNFETSNKLNNVARMFSNCEAITSIKMDKLNTEGVTGTGGYSAYDDGMAEMFNNCRSLTSLDFLQHISTKNCTKFNRMFRSCMSLEEADLHKFETSKVKYINAMFESCRSLKKVSFLQCDLSKVEVAEYMFNDCSQLEVVDFSGVRRMPNLNNVQVMFNGCTSLKTIYCRDYDTDWTTGGKITTGIGDGSARDDNNSSDQTAVFGKGWYDYGVDGGSGGTWRPSTAPSGLVGTPTPKLSIPKLDGESTSDYEARVNLLWFNDVTWAKAKAGDYDGQLGVGDGHYKSYRGLKSANYGGYFTAATLDAEIKYDRCVANDTIDAIYAGPDGYGLKIVKVIFDGQDVTTMTDYDGELYYEVIVTRGGKTTKRDVHGVWSAVTSEPADTINAGCDDITVTISTAETGIVRSQTFYIRPVSLQYDEAIDWNGVVDGQVWTGEQLKPDLTGKMHYKYTRRNGEEVDYVLTVAEKGSAEAATADVVYEYGENIEEEGTITLTGSATSDCADGYKTGGNFYGTKVLRFPIVKVTLDYPEPTYTGKEITKDVLGVKINNSAARNTMSMLVNGSYVDVSVDYSYDNNICVSRDAEGNVIENAALVMTFSSSAESLNFTVTKFFKIVPAPLTVRPKAATVVYGSNLTDLDYDQFEFECEGLVNGETIDGTDGCGNPVFKTMPKPNSDYSVSEGNPSTYKAVGTLHNINYYGGSAPNYEITYETEQLLEVVKRRLFVEADTKEVSFGDAAPTYTYSYRGFASGETASVLTGTPTLSCDYVPYANEMSFDIVVDVTGMSAANYDIEGVDSKLTVLPVELSKIDNLEYNSTEFDNTLKRPTFDLYRYTNANKTQQTLLASGINSNATWNGTNYYYVVYENNYYVGTATVSVNGDGTHYIGSFSKTFEITGACSLTLEKVTCDDPVYTGEEIKFDLSCLEAKYFKVTEYYYLDNPGTDKLEIVYPYTEVDGVIVPQGKVLTTVDLSGYTDADLDYVGDYTNAGAKSLSFNADAAQYSENVTYKNFVAAKYTYRSWGRTYEDYYGDDDNIPGAFSAVRREFEYGDDVYYAWFSNSYSFYTRRNDNTPIWSAGGTETQTITLTGCGFNYTILPKDIDTTNVEGAGAVSIAMPYEHTAYTGSALEPEPIVKYNGMTLVKGTDYTLEYENNTAVGTATVTIKGIRETTPNYGNFKGTETKTFEITKAPLTVRATVDKSEITYGDACPTIGYEIDASQLVGDVALHYADPDRYNMTEAEVLAEIFTTVPDPAVSTNYNVENALRRGVGTYNVTLGAFASNNYELTLENTTFDVTKKELTVKANHDDIQVSFGQSTKVEGGVEYNLKNQYYAAVITGFAYGETIADLDCRSNLRLLTDYIPYPETGHQQAGETARVYLTGATGGTCPDDEDTNYTFKYYKADGTEVTNADDFATIYIKGSLLTITPTTDYNQIYYAGSLDEINASWTAKDEWNNTLVASDFDLEPVELTSTYGTNGHKYVGETFRITVAKGRKTNYTTRNFLPDVDIYKEVEIICRDLTPLDPATSANDDRLKIEGLNADNRIEVAYKNGVAVTKAEVLNAFTIQLKNGMNNDAWENLVEGTDFTLEQMTTSGIGFSGDWTKAGLHRVKISALADNKYCGNFTVDVLIKATMKVSMQGNDSTIFGLNESPEIVVAIGEDELSAGTDYTIVYRNETTGESLTGVTKPGRYTIEVVGAGDYAGFDVEYVTDHSYYVLMPCVVVYNSSKNADFVLTTEAYKNLTYKGYTINNVYALQQNGVGSLVLADDVTQTVGGYKGTAYTPSGGEWRDKKPYGSVVTATFDESFEKVRPITMNAWFGRTDGSSSGPVITTIENCQYLHTDYVTSMYNMFNGCTKLATLDVSTWNTENVTNMHFLFRCCQSLPTQDLSGWVTSKVTDMDAMFSQTFKMTYIDVSTFDVSSLVDIDWMFEKSNTLKRVYCADKTTDWSRYGGQSKVTKAWSNTFASMSSNFVGVASDGTEVTWSVGVTSDLAKAADLGGYFTPAVLTFDVTDVVYTGNTAEPVVSNVDYAYHEDLEEYDENYPDETHLKYVVTVDESAIDVTDEAQVTVSRADFPDKSTTKTFSILPKNIAEGDTEDDTPSVVAKAIADKEYTGSEIVLDDTELSTLLTYNAHQLVAGTDFEISYSNNINVGTATVTLTGIGNYTGTRTVEFNITESCLQTLYTAGKLTIDDIDAQTFTHAAIEPSVVVMRESSALSATTDYVVTFANNVCVGSSTVTIKGANNYDDSDECALTTTFAIEPAALTLKANNVAVTYGHDFSEAATQGYTSTGFIAPDDAATLIEDITYTSEDYTNTKSVGEYKNQIDEVTAKDNADCALSLDNYTVTKADGKLTVNKANLATEDAAGQIAIPEIDDQTYTGSEIEPEITVTYSRNGVALVKGTDYKVSYTDNVNVGTATITIEGLAGSTNWWNGNAITRTFNIVKAELSAEIDENTFVYNGEVQKPTVIVKFGTTELSQSAANYSLTWSNANSTDVGSYTVTVTPGTNFSKVNGETTVSFTYTITKAERPAPTVTAVAETVCNKNDGKITGVTNEMEWSSDNITYTAATGNLENLSDGTYYVRYKESANYKQSAVTTVTIDEGGKLTVTFDVDGGSTVEAKEVCYGETITAPSTTKDCYTFGGWYADEAFENAFDFTTPITDDITLYAKWSINTYTITWKNADGTVLETDNAVECGSTPSYDSATPTKSATAQYTYTFDKWSPTIATVSADATYTATYTSTVNKYAITWVDGDGNTLKIDSLEYGKTASYSGDKPTKTATAQYTYTFNGGWSPSVVSVVADATYTAQFDATVNKYTVTFVDYDDSEISSKDYDYGTAAADITKPTDPTRTGYTFTVWTPTVAEVTEAATYKATYSLDSYTITYNLDGGTVANANPTTYTVNSADITLNNPTRDGYTFKGWSGTDLTGDENQTVTIASGSTGDRTYTANWLRDVTVTFTAQTVNRTYKGTAWADETVYTYASNVDAYTVSAANITYNGADWDDSYIKTSRTDVGTSTVSLDQSKFENKNAAYNVTFVVTGEGELTIEPKAVTVTVKGNNDTKTYTGSEQSVSGYEFDETFDGFVASKVNYTGDEHSTAKGTDVGTYNMTMTSADFSYNDANYDVTFTVVNGTLTITKQAVTITVKGNNATETFDGTAKSVSGYTATSEFAEFDAAKVVYNGGSHSTATGTNVGDYETSMVAGDFSYNDANFTVTFSITQGKLTIEKKSVEILVAGNTDSKTYSGEVQSVTGYALTGFGEGYVAGNVTYSGATAQQTAAGTNVGEYNMDLKGSDFAYSDNNYDVTFTVTNGKLIIAQKEVTITVAGKTETKTYNGAEQSVVGYDLTGFGTGYDATKVSYSGGDVKKTAKGMNVGSYDMTMAASDFSYSDANYKVTFAVTNGKLTIEKKAVTVKVVGKTDSKVYTGSEQSVSGYEFDETFDGFVASKVNYIGDEHSTAKGIDVGTYNMTMTDADFSYNDANYDVTFTVENGALTITKQAVTITVTGNNATETFDGTAKNVTGYTLSATFDGYDESKVVYNGGTHSTATGTNVGEYEMTMVPADFSYDDANFTVTFEITQGKLTIEKKSVEILVAGNTDTKTYSGEVQSVTGYALTGFGEGYVAGNVTYSGTTAQQTAAGTNVGEYNMDLKASDFEYSDNNYDVTFTVTNGKLTITQKEVTITVVGKTETKTYNGAEQSVVGYDLTGFGTGYDATKVSYSGGDVKQTAKGTNVGTYDMSMEATDFSYGDANYKVTFTVTNGKLTIEKKAVTVKVVGDSESKIYTGSEQSVSGYEFDETFDGFVASKVNYIGDEHSTAKGTDVGTYNMTMTDADFSYNDANYDVTFTVENGALTITKQNVTITVTGNNATETFDGTAKSVSGYTATADFAEFDVAKVVYNGGTHSTAIGTNVGEYEMTMVAGDFSYDDANFTVTFSITQGKLTIEKKAVEILVAGNTDTKTYSGEVQSVMGYALTGFGEGYVAGNVTYSGTTAQQTAAGTNVGEYNMDLKESNFAYADDNYDVTFTVTNGKLTIAQKEVTIAVAGKTETKTYNGAEQSVVGYDLTGFGTGYDETKVSYSGGDVKKTAKGMNVGSYDMTMAATDFSYSDANYKVTFTVTNGKLTIESKAVTVTAQSFSINYGETPDYAAHIDYATLADGQTSADLATAAVATSDYGTAGNLCAGEYPITFTTEAADGNYTFTHNTGTLTVNALTITGADVALEYTSHAYTGSALEPSVTVTVAGNTLTEGEDYEVAYADNTEPGTAKVTVTGKCGYTGSPMVNFTIGKGCIVASEVTKLEDTYTYTGSPVVALSDIEVKYNGETLTEGPNGYSINFNSGADVTNVTGNTVTVTVKGTGNYGCEVSQDFTILPEALTATATPLSFDYTGDIQKPTVTVKFGDTELAVSAENYTLSWSDESSTNAGDYTVTVTPGTNFSKVNGDDTYTFDYTINKVAYPAPTGLEAVDETVCDKNDGKITGVTSAMEYSTDGATYTAAVGDLTGLSDGTYYVRVAADANHNASERVKLVIEAGGKLTVTFETNGGSAVEAKQVCYGTTIDEPETSKGDCYTFDGWYKEASFEHEFDFSSPITETTIIYAKFTIKTYTITWKNEDGTVLETDENVACGSTPNYDGETPTKAATAQYTYTFDKWSPEIEEVSGDATYTATYKSTVNKYLIQAISNDDVHGVTNGSAEYEYGSTATLTAESTSDCWVFKNWTSDVAGAVEVSQNPTLTVNPVTAAATYYANFEILTYDLKLTAGANGTVTNVTAGEDIAANTNNTYTYDCGTTVNIKATPASGYSFVKWSDDVTEATRTVTMDAAKDLTATFSAQTYIVTLDGDGATTAGTASVEVTYAAALPAIETLPEKTGYTFAGFYTNQNGAGVQYYNATGTGLKNWDIAANTTLYAKWDVNQYTITFNTDGGTTIAPITQDYGTAVTAPANPTKTGYTFSGWDKTIPGTMPAENVTITAQWTINQYTITFNTDGGTTIDPITADYGAAVTAPADPEKTGYTFNGWDKTIPTTMPAENQTITAKWSINEYTITFNTDGGTTIAPITQN
ncbi:MAG: BspA family leucine-rich repeat surface protein [Marinilabiliaceae bacterium]|nr:BspA family leucine-rich repeat surface protein [Marinilabiliaceae bacterium]